MQQRLIRIIGLPILFFIVLFAASGLCARLSTPASAQAPTLAPAASAATYVLGPNDRIRLKVYGEADITGEYEIDSTGNVSVPLAGHLKAAGLTTRQLERSITSALSKGIVRDPRVNVEIAQYRLNFGIRVVFFFFFFFFKKKKKNNGLITFLARSRRAANIPIAWASR